MKVQTHGAGALGICTVARRTSLFRPDYISIFLNFHRDGAWNVRHASSAHHRLRQKYISGAKISSGSES